MSAVNHHHIHGGSGELINNGKTNQNKNKNKKAVIGYGRKAKRVVLSRIKNAKKRFQRKIKKRKSNQDSGGGGCCLCIRRVSGGDSGSESPTSDPNSAEFGFDALRGLIEKSDFLLSECNTHLNAYTSDDDDDGYIDDDD